MDECDYCMHRYDCIGWIGTKDGGCAGFAVSPTLRDDYILTIQLEEEKKNNSPFGF